MFTRTSAPFPSLNVSTADLNRMQVIEILVYTVHIHDEWLRYYWSCSDKHSGRSILHSDGVAMLSDTSAIFSKNENGMLSQTRFKRLLLINLLLCSCFRFRCVPLRDCCSLVRWRSKRTSVQCFIALLFMTYLVGRTVSCVSIRTLCPSIGK